MLRGTPCEDYFDNYFPLVSGSKGQVSVQRNICDNPYD